LSRRGSAARLRGAPPYFETVTFDLKPWNMAGQRLMSVFYPFLAQTEPVGRLLNDY